MILYFAEQYFINFIFEDNFNNFSFKLVTYYKCITFYYVSY